MPGKVPGLKVELNDGQRRVSTTGSTGVRTRRISDASRSSIMSPTTFSAKNGSAREGGGGGSVHDDHVDTSSEEEEEEEESAPDMKTLTSGGGDLPQEFWQVQKLVRYLKVGNQTATIIALCNLADFDLTAHFCQMAIMDAGGLEVLVNLLETDDVKCKIGSLKILKEIVVHPDIRKAITHMGGIELMVRILADANKHLKLHAAESLAKLAKYKKGRTIVRKNTGIPRVVDLLDVDMSKAENAANEADVELSLDMKVARGGTYALWSLCKSKRNRLLIKKAGGFPLLAKLIKSKNISLLIPVIGTLQECAAEKSYCMAIQAEGMVEDFVSNLLNDNMELRKHCASAIFKCAQEEETRALVKSNGGLEPLVALIKNNENHGNKELMAAVTGALWKLSMSEENVKCFQELELVPVLIGLLKDNSEGLDDLQFNQGKIQVLTNIVGAIAESARTHENRELIREQEGLAPIIRLIASTSPGLLVNVAAAIGQMAEDVESLEQSMSNPDPKPSGLIQIRNLDGVRLLWSLLKNPNDNVQAAAAWSLSPCIRNAENSGDMVRSFVGGLELICNLLESKDQQVLAAVCFAIANIARDKENLAVITDHGVIHKLAKLAHTGDDQLRAKLAEAISNCCELETNRALFGKAGAVAPLVSYLTSADLEVHRTTAAALHQLSKDPWNCVTMHQSGVVTHLLRLIGSEDEDVQEAAADCLQNIRKLALACEKFRYQHLKS